MEIYISVSLLFVSVLMTVVIHRYKRSRLKDLQAQGIVNVSHLKELISFVQVHRGLSSAWLNGDNTKQKNLIELAQKITIVLNKLNKEQSINTRSRWLSFIDHWARLSNKNKNTYANDSFNQHTQLIANLLYLLEDEAERAELDANYLTQLPNIGFVWRELIVTTENIGQSRAIGTGIATTKQCSSVDKIRLSFLHKEIQNTTHKVLSKLGSIDTEKQVHDNLLKTATEQIELFINTLQQELIDAMPITINQDEYFSLASNCMKSLDDIFFHQLNQVKKII